MDALLAEGMLTGQHLRTDEHAMADRARDVLTKRVEAVRHALRDLCAARELRTGDRTSANGVGSSRYMRLC